MVTIQTMSSATRARFDVGCVRLALMNETVAATLTVIAEHVERYRQQLAEVGPRSVQGDREDLRAAILEAEQGLRNAERLLRRAVKLAA